MSYSDFYLKSRNKTPLLLYVLAFIAVGGFAATFLRTSAPSARASKENVVNHTLANLSSHQAAVYYQTTTATPSWVLYGTDSHKLDHAAFDDRDLSDHKSKYYLHYVVLKDLQEKTNYSYSIIADGEVVSINSVSTFTFTTPSTASITTDSSINPAYGKVIEQNNEQVDNGFVIYYYPNAYPLVAPVKGGDWLISLTSLLDRTTGKPIQPNSSQEVKLEIINEELKSTTIETVVANTTPLSKTVIIGTPYSEDQTDAVLSAHIQISVAPSISPVASPKPTAKPTAVPVVSLPIEITFPKEKAIIPGNNPLIKGKAVAGSQVSVVLKSLGQLIYSTKLTADAQGEWKLTLPMPLKAESYILTASSKDSLNNTKTVTRTFTTTKSGEEVVLGTATASATLTPTSVVSTPVPTQITGQLSPTIVLATSTPVPTLAVSTTPPVTGQNNSVIMLASLFMVVIAAGIILFI